jgi:hypothetical protein
MQSVTCTGKVRRDWPVPQSMVEDRQEFAAPQPRLCNDRRFGGFSLFAAV